MRFHSVAAAYALWLLGVFIVFYLSHGGDEIALQVSVMCGAIPAGCQILLLGIDSRGLAAPVKMWLALIMVILLGYVVNVANPLRVPSGTFGSVIPAAWMPIIYTVNTVFILAIVTLVAGCPDRRLLRSIASIYCLLVAPFLVYIDLTGERLWGRLIANGLQPNMWGLVGLTACLAAFARRPGVVAIASFAAGVATIVAASSRENLLSLASALFVVMALYLLEINRYRLLAVLAVSSAVLVLSAVLLDPYIVNAIDYLKSDILLLDSQRRGLNSGFTGRTEVWIAAVNVWLKSPLLGVGFRQHESFMPEMLAAHNAYLAMLADTGLVGLIFYLVLLISSLCASFGIQDQRTRRFSMAVIVAYIVSGFFDRRTIDGGNPYSLFFLMCCSVALTDQSLRRATALYRRVLQMPMSDTGRLGSGLITNKR
jgi:O-antigen ligase